MSKAVPEGWTIQTLDGKVHILSGFPFKSSLFTDDPDFMGIIRIRDLEKQSIETFYAGDFDETYVVRRGDVLIGMDGDFNIVKWNAKNALLNQRVCKVKAEADSSFDTDFLFQSLKDDLLSINAATGATTVKHLSVKDIRGIEKAYPPLPEQQKIATILSSVDDVIEKTRAQIDKLKDLKTGMMQELLTQGIGHTEFKNTPIGRIPKEWDVAAIADIARLTSGGTPNRENSDYWNGDVLWVKTGEVNYQTIFDTEEKITVLGLKDSSAKLVPAGAILMAMYGQGITRGKVAKLGVPAAMNQACLAMIPNNQIINDFLYYFLSREYFNLRSMVQEGAQKNLSASIIKEILLPVPPRKEQQKIVDVLQSIDTKIMTASQKLISVEQTKKALMQDLLIGKIRVKLGSLGAFIE